MEINTKTRRVYFDTNLFIYLIESNPAYQEKIHYLISALDAMDCKIFTSELTLAECLVKPFADNDEKSQEVYLSSIKTSEFLTVKAVSKKVIIEAARLRASLKNKLPDSIHLATALESNCDVFVGNDRHIKTGEGMQYILLDTMPSP